MKQVPPAHKVVGDEGKPGQTLNGGQPVKYLRDVIKKYQEEEWRHSKTGCCHKTVTVRCHDCPYNASEPLEATTPSTQPEKSLERLKQALLDYCKELDSPPATSKVQVGHVSDTLRNIIKENT